MASFNIAMPSMHEGRKEKRVANHHHILYNISWKSLLTLETEPSIYDEQCIHLQESQLDSIDLVSILLT
ncbi:hypothetical protein BLOT_013994 [Blomia tropicalis]|nr:hypothetical protein BLOT_013994 [Blomia tropicalis]